MGDVARIWWKQLTRSVEEILIYICNLCKPSRLADHISYLSKPPFRNIHPLSHYHNSSCNEEQSSLLCLIFVRRQRHISAWIGDQEHHLRFFPFRVFRVNNFLLLLLLYSVYVIYFFNNVDCYSHIDLVVGTLTFCVLGTKSA